MGDLEGGSSTERRKRGAPKQTVVTMKMIKYY
jgi:hypothetical protein